MTDQDFLLLFKMVDDLGNHVATTRNNQGIEKMYNINLYCLRDVSFQIFLFACIVTCYKVSKHRKILRYFKRLKWSRHIQAWFHIICLTILFVLYVATFSETFSDTPMITFSFNARVRKKCITKYNQSIESADGLGAAGMLEK